jgi:hypothetical protein
MEEVLTQMGGIEEFENASIFAQERMAAAAGMTVEQLSKSLSLQAKAAELSEDEFKTLNGMNLTKEEISEMAPAELKAMAQQAQATEAINKNFEKISNELIAYIMPVAEGLIPVFNIIAGIIQAILIPFTLLRELATDIGVTVGGWAQSLGPFGIILKTIAGIGIILAAYGAYLSLSFIPIVGSALGAIAAAAVMTAGFTALNKVGDLAIDANGGPIVASPREGTLFQGTNNDQLAMGPGVLESSTSQPVINTTTVTNDMIDYDKLATAVANAIQKLKIIIDDSAVGAIAKQGAVLASYR